MSLNIVQKGVIGLVLTVIFLLSTVCIQECFYKHKIASYEVTIAQQKTILDTRLDVIRLLNDRLKESPKKTTTKKTEYFPAVAGSTAPVSSYVETIIEEPIITHSTVYVNVPAERKRLSIYAGYTFNGAAAAGFGYYIGREITIGFKAEGRYAGLFLLWGFK